MSQDEVTVLVQKRGRLKGSLTRQKTFVDTMPVDTSASSIVFRLEKLDELFKDLVSVDDEIMTFSGQVSDYETFEETYYYVHEAYSSALAIRSMSDGANSTANVGDDLNATISRFVTQQQTLIESLTSRSRQTSSDIKLPRLNIKPFSGLYQEWPAFKDLYLQTIHNNSSLSSIQKFQFLKGVITDDAAALVRHMLVTADNYEEAWEKLVDRFDKKKYIVGSYLKLFFEQPSISCPTSENLQRLADTSDEVIRALSSLGGDASTRDPWLCYLIASKLDPDTRQHWAEETADVDIPSFDQLLKFLIKRSDMLQAVKAAPVKKVVNNFRSHHSVETLLGDRAEVNRSGYSSYRCIFCHRGNHPLYKCNKFIAISPSMRFKFVGEKKLCFNCLQRSHSASSCISGVACGKCSQRHHTLLHLLPSTSSNIGIAHENKSTAASTDNKTCLETSSVASRNTSNENDGSKYFTDSNIPCSSFEVLNSHVESFTLLPTALVHVVDNFGQKHMLRALLDSGSQVSFVTENCVSRLSLPRTQAKLSINGIGSTKAGTTRGKVLVKLQSRLEPFKSIDIRAFVLNRLTNYLPSVKSQSAILSQFSSLQLADPDFSTPQKIDLLIGADYFFQLLLDGRVTGNEGSILAQNTIFGYVLSGSLGDNQFLVASSNLVSCDLDKSLRCFWETEEPPCLSSEYTDEEKFCEEHFVNNYYFDERNRFVVRLPFLPNKPELGDSLGTAVSRLTSIERRLNKLPLLRKDYCSFMQEYESLDHMKIIPPNELSVKTDLYYLPHHCVIRTSSSTTKCRVVFDGSCRTTNNISLNEKLAVGPTVQPTLLHILLNFRRFKIAFTSDVEKMYRQIRVSPADQDYQRIVWRESQNDNLQHFRLTTVTYGTTSAPFLAIRCLKQIGLNLQEKNPTAANVILQNFYVDDLISGSDDVHSAISLKNTIVDSLSFHGFNLRKWSSNSSEFLRNVPTEQREVNIVDIEECESIKILGLSWNPMKDVFSYKVSLPSKFLISKRSILSESSKIFDPLGLVSPSIVLVKMLLQKLWMRGCSWDEVLEGDVASDWLKIRSEFSLISKIEVPRWLSLPARAQLFGFADASELAYAAVVYCRSVDTSGIVRVNIVMSKTKVSPIKQVSIPRLELCAAFLLANLIRFIQPILNIANHDCFAYSDSMIVLAWLSEYPRKWSSYVANRTSAILDILPRSQWNHVSTEENPADIASRGALPSSLMGSKLWWNGPDWLSTSFNKWPAAVKEIPNTILELKQSKCNVLVASSVNVESNDLVLKLLTSLSSYTKIIRVLCLINRFIQKCKSIKTGSDDFRFPFITASEFKHSEYVCIKWTQSQCFSRELKLLTTAQTLPNSSVLSKLTPFLDDSGLFRVGGRLKNANCGFDIKHPIILPKNSLFGTRLIQYFHLKYLHAGASLLISIIRQKYWIIGCRNSVKGVINKCVPCIRQKHLRNSQLMADLPRYRVCPDRPFKHCGVDYAGPIKLRTHSGRSFQIKKAYIALFICCVTKAIHLEVVSELSSAAFIATLKRFISRRGIPSDMYSDNGTNFVGAYRIINKQSSLIQISVASFMAENNMNWHYNPPAAPHFGGLWESAVKSVKHHVKRTLGESLLTYEEFTTVLCQIEAILNSRPLGPLNENDESNYDTLTPGHFIAGGPLTQLPEPSLLDKGLTTLNRWNRLSKLVQTFWMKWHKDYLTTLQNRPKWRQQTSNLKVGEIVILKEDSVPPAIWPLARITDLHPGSDGLVRTVSLKTSSGQFKRPIVKVVRLFEC